MNLFISWSGTRSEETALLLRKWIPFVFQSVNCWVSKGDIPLGSRWYFELSNALEATNFGIICITKENLNSNWINFEAGALSRHIKESKIIPYLINLEKHELKGPLSFFQAADSDKEGTYNVFKEIANSNENNFRDEETLKEIFEMSWTSYSEKLNEIKTKPITSFPDKKLTILTSRQLEILRLLSEGKSRKEVAVELHSSLPTIINYISHMRSKLMVKSIDEMILIAKQNELI